MGGDFTDKSDDKQWSLERDGDMCGMLDERPDALGFMGSDRWNELDPEEQLKYRFLRIAPMTVRFAIATTPRKYTLLADKIKKKKDMVLATSYPTACIDAMAGLMRVGPLEVSEIVETCTFKGSIESKPKTIERVDGIFEMVDTGSTIEAEGLEILKEISRGIDLGAVSNR